MNDQQRSIKRIEELVGISNLASARHAELIAAEIKLSEIRAAYAEYLGVAQSRMHVPSATVQAKAKFVEAVGRILSEP